jgi:hypothetical protein
MYFSVHGPIDFGMYFGGSRTFAGLELAAPLDTALVQKRDKLGKACAEFLGIADFDSARSIGVLPAVHNPGNKGEFNIPTICFSPFGPGIRIVANEGAFLADFAATLVDIYEDQEWRDEMFDGEDATTVSPFLETYRHSCVSRSLRLIFLRMGWAASHSTVCCRTGLCWACVGLFRPLTMCS